MSSTNKSTRSQDLESWKGFKLTKPEPDLGSSGAF